MTMNALSIQPTDVIRALQSQHVPRVIWVVNLLLVIWIASLLATLTWDFIGSSETPEDVVAEIRSLNGIKGIQVIPSKEEDRKLVLEVEHILKSLLEV